MKQKDTDGTIEIRLRFRGQSIIVARKLPARTQAYRDPDAVAGAMEETFRAVWSEALTKMEQVASEVGP